MKVLPIISMRDVDTSSGVPMILRDLVKAFAEQNIAQFDEYIATMPESEGYAPTARQEAVEIIVKEFVTFLADPKIPDVSMPDVTKLRSNSFNA